MSYYTKEESEREMLHRIGILPKKKLFSEEDSFKTFADLISGFVKAASATEKEDSLLKRIEDLESRVEELEREKKLISYLQKLTLFT